MAARNGEPEIRDVWITNLEVEMQKIRDAIDKYPYVAMVRRFIFAFWSIKERLVLHCL
jgi:CCR4-NOT transcription complex subunit 7/8